jgi:uncharacterized protein
MIFLDTGFLFALFVNGDAHHAPVRDVFEEYRGRKLDDLLLTTNHVVAETITLLRKKAHPEPQARHDIAVRVGRQLLSGHLARVHRATEGEERDALAYLARYQDQQYSFVDCLSFVVMEKLGIREALAVDSDFTHRFSARPGPRPK